jgi:toxin YoeB
MKIHFTETGWKDYLYWEEQDKKTLKQINKLIEDIKRNGYDGIGKPEPLRGFLSGWWCRRNRAAQRSLRR